MRLISRRCLTSWNCFAGYSRQSVCGLRIPAAAMHASILPSRSPIISPTFQIASYPHIHFISVHSTDHRPAHRKRLPGPSHRWKRTPTALRPPGRTFARGTPSPCSTPVQALSGGLRSTPPGRLPPRAPSPSRALARDSRPRRARRGPRARTRARRVWALPLLDVRTPVQAQAAGDEYARWSGSASSAAATPTGP